MSKRETLSKRDPWKNPKKGGFEHWISSGINISVVHEMLQTDTVIANQKVKRNL